MDRREALISMAAGTQWLWDQLGRQQAADAAAAEAARPKPARPWDIAIEPELSISQTEVAPGAAFVHLKLTLDRDPFMTTRVALEVSDASARGFRPSDFGARRRFQALWSPGDDLDQYLSVPLPAGDSQPGWAFRMQAPARLRQGGWRGAREGLAFEVRVVESQRATSLLPERMPRQRPLHRLITGTPGFDQDMSEIQWSRTGLKADGTPVWRTSLQYGDGPANANERGLYANAQTYPDSDAHLKEVDASGRPYVRLHTRRFEQPVRELDLAGRPLSRSFPFQASWLSAQTLEGLCHETGLWEFEFISPDRYGAWAAHWMTGVRENRTVWPPEIDVFEHFNGVYGPWNSRHETSSALHYGDFGRSRAGSCGTVVDLEREGFDPGVDLTSRPHLSQCLVTDDFITIFMDGRETVQFRHILKPVSRSDTRKFHPIVNVAVAPARATDPYNQGSGDMLFYGYRYYPLEEIAFEAEPLGIER